MTSTQAPATRSKDPRSRLFTARQLLRDGHHDEAGRLARAVGEEEPALLAASLDLQARVFREQQRPSEARARWEEALKLEPANTEFRRAIERLDGPKLTGPLLIVPAVLGAVLAVWFLFDRIGANKEEFDGRMGELKGELDHQAVVTADVQQDQARTLGELGTSLSNVVAALPVDRQRNQTARAALRSELESELEAARAQAIQSSEAMGQRIDAEESARGLADDALAAERERLALDLRGELGGLESQLVQSTQAIESTRRSDLQAIEARDAALAAADVALAATDAELNAADAELAAADVTLAAADAALAATDAELAAADDALTATDVTLAAADAELAAADVALAVTDAELAATDDALTATDVTLAAADAELAAANVALAATDDALTATDVALAAADAAGATAREALAGELGDLSNAVQDQARNLGTLTADQSALRVGLERLGLDQSELSLALEAGTAARETLDEQDSALAQRLAEFDQRSSDALAAGLATRAELARVEELHAALQASLTQVASLQERLGTSEQRTRNAEEQVIGLVDLLLMLEERLAALEAGD